METPRRFVLIARILLVDDHQLFRSGLRALIGRKPGLEVVGEARDGREAFRLAREVKPDVVIMDLEMPGLNGIEATRRFAVDLPQMRVIILSMHAGARFVEEALEAGAVGYLLKDCAAEELVRAIQDVMLGRTYLSSWIAGILIGVLKNHRRLTESSAATVLTDRESEVLQLLAEGQPTREIASRLHMSPKTVATHREHLMEKLHIRSIAGLTKYAMLEGLTPSEPVLD